MASDKKKRRPGQGRSLSPRENARGEQGNVVGWPRLPYWDKDEPEWKKARRKNVAQNEAATKKRKKARDSHSLLMEGLRGIGKAKRRVARPHKFKGR